MAMEWTDELIARLKELWEQGLSTAEIGRQLSITKNAVVGKAHRLGLPPRPSPIRNKAAAEGAGKTTRSRTSRAKKAEEASAGDDAEAEKTAVADQAAAQPVEKKTSTARATKAAAEKVEKPVRAKGAETAARAESAAKGAASRKDDDAAVMDDEVEDISPRPVASASQRKVTPPRRVRDTLDRPSRQGPTCQWPIGDPGTPDFHFCGATPLSGKPYCAEHAAIAYVKIRDRRH